MNTPDTKPVAVVLVDDHRMFRSGVKAELGSAVSIVGEAPDVDSAIAVIKQTRPPVDDADDAHRARAMNQVVHRVRGVATRVPAGTRRSR